MNQNLKPNSPLVRLKHSLFFIWLQDLNWSGSKRFMNTYCLFL
ncbi:Uncharacterised protein [Acholeplasma oculi]|nr:hypothetical protein SAMN02745122_0981 [Acholeplasma oculi]SUT88680.1 Uncharacterised protein [Acholeplasma oculi]